VAFLHPRGLLRKPRGRENGRFFSAAQPFNSIFCSSLCTLFPCPLYAAAFCAVSPKANSPPLLQHEPDGTAPLGIMEAVGDAKVIREKRFGIERRFANGEFFRRHVVNK